MELNNNLQTWINLVGANDVWGAKTISFLDYLDRQKLVNTAKSFTTAVFDKLEGYKSPNTSPPTFRCDGIIEYCYEFVLGEEWRPADQPPYYHNGGIVPDDVSSPICNCYLSKYSITISDVELHKMDYSNTRKSTTTKNKRFIQSRNSRWWNNFRQKHLC